MRRHSIINEGQKKSPSARKIIKLRQRAFQQGGASLELQIPTNYIRDISRKVNADVTRDTARRNLLNWSEEFDNAAWGKVSTFVTANAISSPNGTLVSDKLIASIGGGTAVQHRLDQTITAINGIYTYSVYAKAAEYTGINIRIGNSGGAFELSNGTVNNSFLGATASIISVGSGWYRCVITYTATNETTIRINILQNGAGSDFIGDSSSGIYIYGAQLEAGSVATAYQPTQTTNTDTGASLIMTPNTIGESRLFNAKPDIALRNIINNSEDFSISAAANWSRAAVNINSNVLANPLNGNLDADKVVSTAGTSIHAIQQYRTNTAKTSTSYTGSVYVKAAEYTTFSIFMGNSAGSSPTSAKINLTNGTVMSGTATVTDVGSGWYRVSKTHTSSDTGVSLQFYLVDTSSYLGDGVSGIYLWGAQLEFGSTATAYQRTTDGITDFQATRATTATVIQKDGSIGDGCYNLLQRSEEFDNAYWLKTSSIITTNATTDPNGNTTADKLIANAVTAIHSISSTAVTDSGVNKFYTTSVYVKAAEVSTIVIRLSDVTVGSTHVYFNTSTKTFSNPNLNISWANLSYTYFELPNGWFRVILTAEKTNGTGVQLVLFPLHYGSYLGNGTDGIYIWGAQLIQGLQPKDYLKTTNRLNVPSIDYTELRTNLLLRSEEFDDNTVWIPNIVSGSNVIVTVNATTAPNGTSTADKLTSGNSLQNDFIRQAPTLISGANANFSVYIKNNDSLGTRIWGRISTTAYEYILNWSGQTITSVTNVVGNSLTYTQLANGWYRISVPYVSTEANQWNRIMPDIFNNGKSVYAWGAQLEYGNIATEYIPTTSTTVTVSNFNANKPSLLVEPQRTNILTRSVNTSIAPWVKTGATSTENIALAPNNTNTASVITENNVDTLHYAYHEIATTIGTYYTYTQYLKKADVSWIQLLCGSAHSTNIWVNFNFDTGLFGNKGSGTFDYSAKSVGNGWYRLQFGFSSLTSIATAFCIIAGTNNTDSVTRISSYLGTLKNLYYCWGAQLEAGSNSTSYIPTAGAAVPRNAYTSYVDLWNNNLLNKDNFTLYVEGNVFEESQTNTSVCFSDTTRIGAYGNELGFYAGLNPFSAVAGVPNVALGSKGNKHIIQRNGDTVKWFKDGAQFWTTQTIPVFDYRYLTINSGGSNYNIQKIALWKHTKSDAECVTLTT